MKASSRAIEAAWAARNAFASGDETLAFAEAVRAVSFGETAPDLLDLFHLLAATQDPAPAADLLGQALEDTWGDWPPPLHAEIAAIRFDRLIEAGVEGPPLAGAALAALEAAAGGGPDAAGNAWTPLADPGRRERILRAADSDPASIADALEHLSFAPRRAGIQSDATRFAEQVAYAHAGERPVVRAAERLLFAIAREPGPEADAARDTARRLEAMRKRLAAGDSRQRPGAAAAAVAPAAGSGLDGASIVLVGGHDGLRAAARALLAPRAPREIRDLPPTWEGQRGGGAEAAVRGADLVVLVIRQLDHSTGDAAEAAAREFGAAVRRARSASTAAIIAAIDDWAAHRSTRR
ncbi:MAG: hypothetical protein ACKOWF_14475 [Chloroflexota bacterium]